MEQSQESNMEYNFAPVLEEHYGKQVWTNKFYDKVRKTGCLCFSCANFHPEQPNNCRIAQALYELCVATDIAAGVSRCPEWAKKES